MAAVPEATFGAVAALAGGAHGFATFAVAVVGVAVLRIGAFGSTGSVATRYTFATRSADFICAAVAGAFAAALLFGFDFRFEFGIEVGVGSFIFVTVYSDFANRIALAEIVLAVLTRQAIACILTCAVFLFALVEAANVCGVTAVGVCFAERRDSTVIAIAVVAVSVAFTANASVVGNAFAGAIFGGGIDEAAVTGCAVGQVIAANGIGVFAAYAIGWRTGVFNRAINVRQTIDECCVTITIVAGRITALRHCGANQQYQHCGGQQ